MDSPEDETPLLGVETEMKELLGMFDAPAFARRGLELEHAHFRLSERFRRERGPMLDMVRLRLRQWAAVADQPGASILEINFDELARLVEGTTDIAPATLGGVRKPRAVARDLIASAERFNLRWTKFVEETNYAPINHMIERYNRYYLIEKECTMRSARLAARNFEPRPSINTATIFRDFPLLPVPRLLS